MKISNGGLTDDESEPNLSEIIYSLHYTTTL